MARVRTAHQGLHLRALASNSSGRAVSDFAGIGARIVLALALGRLAGPRDLGLLGLGTVIGGIALLPALAGVDGWVSLAAARLSHGRRSVPTAEGLRVVWVTAPLTAAILVLGGLAFGGDGLVVGAGAAALAALQAPALVLRAGFAGAGLLRLVAAGGAAEGLVAVAVGVPAVKGGLGAGGALAALALGRLANLATSAFLYHRRVGSLRAPAGARSRREVIAASRYFAAMRPLVTGIQRADTLLVGALLGPLAVGLYGAATNLTLTVPIVASAIAEAAIPRVYGPDAGAAGDASRQLLRMLGPLGVITAAVLAAGAAPITGLLYGSGFGASVTLLRVLALSVPLVFTNVVLASALVGRRRERDRVVAQTGALASNVVCNLLLLPWIGVVGAAWATVASEVVHLVLQARAVRRHNVIPPAAPTPAAEGAAVLTY